MADPKFPPWPPHEGHAPWIHGTRPPGLPRSEIGDCYDFGVWWWTLPTRRGDEIRWSHCLRATDGLAWDLSTTGPPCKSRDEAEHFGRIAACCAAQRGEDRRPAAARAALEAAGGGA